MEIALKRSLIAAFVSVTEEEIDMVALTDLILAATPEEYDELTRQLRAEQAALPSDAEVLTAFMRDCTDMDGRPLLQAGEHADLVDGKVIVKKLN
jgi:hypothetical protein